MLTYKDLIAAGQDSCERVNGLFYTLSDKNEMHPNETAIVTTTLEGI